MRRGVRVWGVGAALLLCFGCGGGSSLFREGRKAELRKDWDTALIKYEKALQVEPENANYLIHERIARTQGSLFHLKQGRRLVAAGRTDEAAGEFQKAVGIDPTNEAAGQELGRLLAQQTAVKRAREESIQQALKAREQAAGPSGVQLKPWPTEPLAHFRISADSRKVYETLAKLADLNVAFTSDFQPKQVSVDLTNVKIEDALRVVSYQTKTFWRAVTSNTILVVPDTPTNRRDYEEEVLKTIYLSNPLTPADRTAITTALKQVLGLQRIVDNPDSNAIIIRDTPAKVAAAEKMIRDLDQNKAEILVEVAVVEADRSRIRDLGLTLATVNPSSGTITPGLQGAAVFAPIAATSGGTVTVASNVGIGNISYRNYALVLPSATASAVLNDSRTSRAAEPAGARHRRPNGQAAHWGANPLCHRQLPTFAGRGHGRDWRGLRLAGQHPVPIPGGGREPGPDTSPDGERGGQPARPYRDFFRRGRQVRGGLLAANLQPASDRTRYSAERRRSEFAGRVDRDQGESIGLGPARPQSNPAPGVSVFEPAP